MLVRKKGSFVGIALAIVFLFSASVRADVWLTTDPGEGQDWDVYKVWRKADGSGSYGPGGKGNGRGKKLDLGTWEAWAPVKGESGLVETTFTAGKDLPDWTYLSVQGFTGIESLSINGHLWESGFGEGFSHDRLFSMFDASHEGPLQITITARADAEIDFSIWFYVDKDAAKRPKAASAAVPEPATIAVLGLGLAGLGLVRRRQK